MAIIKMHSDLINSSDHLSISVIGIGGTGTEIARNLVKIALLYKEIYDKGILVDLVDIANVKESNIIRQSFYPEDIDKNKAEVLAKRINMNYGFEWEHRKTFTNKNITFIAVDNIASRKKIYNFLFKYEDQYFQHGSSIPYYIIDCGNSFDQGQIFFTDIKNNTQTSFDFYGEDVINKAIKNEDLTPSCSTIEAIKKQSPFINSMIADNASKLLWDFLVMQKTDTKAVFLNNHESRILNF